MAMEFPVFDHVCNRAGADLLPHRQPFLFVDTLFSCDSTGAVGEYTFTLEKNDFFKGHFPKYPVVPGVVLVEAIAQVAGAAVVERKIIGEQVSFAMVAFDGVRFRQPVRPGDRLVTVVKVVRERAPLGIYECKGYLNGEPNGRGEPAVEATVKCMMSDAGK